MDRITHSTAVDIGGGRRGFRSKDTQAGVPGTVAAATWLNAVQEEVMAVIEKAGLTPNSANLLQMVTSVRSQRLNYCPAGGTANALTITLDPAPSTLAELVGVPLRVLITTTNTDAVTLKQGALAATPVRMLGGAEIARGQLTPGIAEFVYDGAVFQLTSLTPAAFSRGGRLVSTASGTWVCPPGVFSVYAECLGAGGSGGNSTTSGDAATGGNGGAFGSGVYPVVPGTGYVLTVGLGGAVPAAGPNSGNTGGASSFGAFLTANGGAGGVPSNGGGIQTGVQPNATVAGANVLSLIGSQSQPAWSTGASVIVQSPGGPPAVGGAYGDRVGVATSSSAAGKNAVTRGQGGNGAVGNNVGGGGQPGLVSLFW